MSSQTSNLPVSARDIAAAVRAGRCSALAITESALAKIAAQNGRLNAFTEVLAERARKEARAVDAAVARGMDPGPLAGVPYAVKNLYDIEGLPTLAGSKIGQSRPPATADAALLRRMSAAGAVLLGALNMDEYAFGFSTQNTHYGPTRNPHAPDRIAGGSSGGSAAAVAAGLAPLTLGSDTNGSIRVPAALCGVYGLKPTYGRLSRSGTQLFASSLDCMGPLAGSVADLAAAYDVLQGRDPADPALTQRNPEPVSHLLRQGIEGLRIAVAGGHFAEGGVPEVFAAVHEFAAALGVTRRVELPQAAQARAAAMIITAVEGAEIHLPHLREHSAEFDPKTRYLFLAGCMAPAAWYGLAQRFRRRFCQLVARVFQEVDVIIAPATPYPAFPIGTETMQMGGAVVPASAYLGLFTQPLSFSGLPVIAAPAAHAGPLPIGVQIAAAPWREDLAFRVAHAAEAAGILKVPPLPHQKLQ